MKAKLLSLFAMVLMAIGVQAQWTAPVAPESPFKGAEYVADGTTAYYLYNVGCGQFVTGANSWSTQISVGKNSEPMLELVVEALDEVDAEQYPGAVKVRLNPTKGNQTVDGASGKRDFNGTYLFRDSEGSGFIDRNGQACWFWLFTKAESGNYYWQSAYNLETEDFLGGYADAATQYASASAEGAAVIFNSSAEDANIEWAFVPVEGLDKEAIPAYAAAMELYNAKLNLYNALNEAKEAGVSTDAATAVYENAEATVAELNTAAAKLRAAIKELEFGDKWDDAAEDNPMDVTDEVMVNPSFDFENGLEGWTIKGATPATASWDAQGPNSTGTMGEIGDDSWGKNCEVYHAAFDISQYIDFLPAGVYKFTCQGFYRPDDEDVPAELYAIFPDGSEQIAKIAHIEDYATVDKLYENGTEWYGDATRNGKYVPNGMNGAMYHFRHYTEGNEELDYTSVLNIVVTEPIAGITIGVRTKSGGTWVIFDNFTLTYYGKVDPNKLELADLWKKNNQVYKIDEIHANKDVKEAYEAAMEVAEDPEGNYEELLNNLKAATEALAASIADYKELETVYAETRALADQLETEHADWEAVVSVVSALADEMQEKVEDELADRAYLEAVRDSALNTLRNAIADGSVKVQAGDDLTILLVNPDFSKTDADQHVAPGWEGKVKELSKQWGNIENYGDYGAGHIEQTIKNMPVGAYDVTVQGFVRGNYNKVTLFAGDSKTCFKRIDEEYATEPSWGTPEEVQTNGYPYDSYFDVKDENGDPVLDDNGDPLVGYRPNSMQGAAAAFAKVNPMTGEPFYTNHVRIVLTKAGDLTIGVDVKEAVDEEIWAIWDNFRIKYAGSEISLFADEIKSRQDKIRAAEEAEDAFVTVKAKENADLAILAGDEALAGDDINAVFAAMTQLEEAEAYLKEGAKLAKELMELATLYVDYYMSEIESGDTEYKAFVEGAQFPDATEYADNEAIQAAIDRVRSGWAGYVMYDIKDIATADNPQDITPIIYNVDYIDPIEQTDSYVGWTVTNDGGYVTPAQNELEFYNNNSFDLHQDLIGLAPGFYRVGVQGFYRAGFPGNYTKEDSLLTTNNAILYTKTLVDNYEKPLANCIDGAQEWSESDGESELIFVDPETEEETVKYMPNDMTSAAIYLSAGYYPNELIFEVGEDGKATIGIYREKHIDGDWTIFSFWTLEYMGTVAPDAIEDVIVADGKTKTTNWYDLTGRRVQKLTKGLYIMGGRKVLVK